ncbi:MAG: 3-dehydroquinate synthase [Candidatus Acidiferrales bacterium]
MISAPGSLAQASQLIAGLGESTGIFFVSSPKVWRHWGRAVAKAIPSAGNGRRPILFDDAESKKRLATVEDIARQLVRAGADRRATIVAVGGGVVGDVAGFAAATYLRGVRLVHVPTTLVAQVDSAVGGKTAVDLPEGKNLVGAFYPPKLVIVDPHTLRTLPHREFRSGLYEIVKYGVIADPKLFAFLAKRMDTVLRRDPKALDYIISRSIAIKADVVSKDERESSVRQILNFGHTLGHALETATNYRRFLHGEAVGWGMLAVTSMALQLKELARADAIRILELIVSVGPLPRLGNLSPSLLRRIMASDKKARAGRVLWVLPRRIGKTEWGRDVPWPVVARTIHDLPVLGNELFK